MPEIDEIVLEKATSEDCQAVFNLYRLVARHGAETGSTDWNDEYPDMSMVEHDIKNDALYLLRENGEIVGTVALSEDDHMADWGINWTQGRAVVISRLCLNPKIQGRGISKKLVTYMEGMARGLGYSYSRLLASISNPVAVGLYPKIGYTRVGEINKYNTDFVAYEKAL